MSACAYYYSSHYLVYFIPSSPTIKNNLVINHLTFLGTLPNCLLLQYDGYFQLDGTHVYFSGIRRALGLSSKGPAPDLPPCLLDIGIREIWQDHVPLPNRVDQKPTSSTRGAPLEETSDTQRKSGLPEQARDQGGEASSYTLHIPDEENVCSRLSIPSPPPAITIVAPITSIQLALLRNYFRLPVGIEIFFFLKSSSESMYLLFDNHEPLSIVLKLRKQLMRERETVYSLLCKLLLHDPKATPWQQLQVCNELLLVCMYVSLRPFT